MKCLKGIVVENTQNLVHERVKESKNHTIELAFLTGNEVLVISWY